MYRTAARTLLLLLFWCAPAYTFANVYVSEVAWMGSVENANAEWIELYNDGPAQDLTGWTLFAEDGQPEVSLSGTIPAQSYAVLERTSDATVPSVSALLIYTGALGNTGEVLVLRDAAGTVQDRVDGSDEWALGGDNSSKDTLQRSGTPAVGGWITGAATPGAGGGVARTEDDEATSDETADTRTDAARLLSGEEAESRIKTQRKKPALVLDAGADRTVVVGLPVAFSARTYQESGKEIVVHDVVWNFGDGTTAQGREVEHTYAHTGSYAVVATGNRGGFLQDIIATDRLVVTVREPSFAITHADEKYIEIENTSSHDLDLSGSALAVGSRSFRLPKGTMILPETSVRFSKQTTGLAVRPGETAGLFYPDDTLAVVYRQEPATTIAVAPAVSTPPRAVATVEPKPVAEVSPPPVPPLVGPVRFDEVVLPEMANVAEAYAGEEVSALTTNSVSAWWILGLAGVILVTVLVVLLVRHEQAEVVEGFEIESDE